MLLTAADIARQVGGQVVGDASIELKALAPADAAHAGDLTFAENEDYLRQALSSTASAILIGESLTAKATSKTLIRVPNARIAFAKVLALFFPPPKFTGGIHSTAVVASTAQIDPTAHIGPHCVIGERANIGPRAVLQGGDHVGADCVMGGDSILFPRVTLYPRTQIGNRVMIHAGTVIGSDGFGYVADAGTHRKVPQVGNVIIHDDVEIGANVTIDRAALGSTVIGKGTKIDNLVQIAHNVIIGEHSILISQVGIAGSTKLGNYVTLAGQVGLAGHLKIGDSVTIAAQSGVMSDIPENEKWLGTPALPDREMKRIYLAMRRLPELLQRIAALERKSNSP
jgi:UDP-3-O-[3-hydroxymyristoyl] glucosamine N-acyltransferase